MSQDSYNKWREKFPQKWRLTKCREYAKERARRQLAKKHDAEFKTLFDKEFEQCT